MSNHYGSRVGGRRSASARYPGLCFVLLSFAVVLAFAAPASAQYIYIDTNGNGLRDAGDAINASGSTTLDIWLDTSRNRDGSTAPCDLGFYSYEFILHAVGGTISWGTYVNGILSIPNATGVTSSATDFHLGFFGTTGPGPGLYKLGSLGVEIASGNPCLVFATSTVLSASYSTSFGSCCPGARFDNTLRLGSDWSDADGTLCAVPPVCTIGGDATVCAAGTGLVYTVSSPVVGATFTWSITGNGTIQSVSSDGSSATVNAGTVGAFTLSVLSEKDGASSSCEYAVNVENCTENCPRTAGFWTQQCAQKGNGSTKFTVAEVSQIAECVDDRVSIFDWAATTDFASFCGTVNPPSPMNQRKQAKRQFATMLANVCTGQLGLVANNGDKIFLGLDTPINCAGLTSGTIGGVIGEVDGRLVSLEGQPLSDPLVKDEYSNLIACLDAINNGIGIGTVCPEAAPVPGGGIGLARGVVGRVFAALPAPNPFSQSTYFVLAVTGAESKPVDVRVFDVSGKLVRILATGSLPPGRHEMVWDGYSEQARRMPTGVYFLQSAVGEEKAVIRLLYLR